MIGRLFLCTLVGLLISSSFAQHAVFIVDTQWADGTRCQTRIRTLQDKRKRYYRLDRVLFNKTLDCSVPDGRTYTYNFKWNFTLMRRVNSML